MDLSMLKKSSCITAALVGAGMFAAQAQAVVVTITSGADAGLVVFNSAGYENQSPDPLLPPANGSYTAVNPANGLSTVLTGSSVATDGPTAAYSGSNYLGFSRVSGGTSLAADFTRAINLGTESFTLTYATWGNDAVSSYTIGEGTIEGGTNSTPGVLSSWRYNPGAVGGSGFGQFGGDNDQLQTLSYNMDGWNTFVYAWDHTTGVSTVTLNGNAVVLQRTNNEPQPTAVSRFLSSTGPNGATIYMDAIPEPASAVLLASSLLLMTRRSRRRSRLNLPSGSGAVSERLLSASSRKGRS